MPDSLTPWRGSRHHQRAVATAGGEEALEAGARAMAPQLRMADPTPAQVSELRRALNEIGGGSSWNHKIIVLPPGPPAAPKEFAGRVTITWPATRNGRLPGCLVSLHDAESGEQVTTVTGISLIHASADDIVWAEITMFADEDGKPVLNGEPVLVGVLSTGDKTPRLGTFPFLVTEMRVADGA